MAEAIRMLGDLARFVKDRDPELAGRLLPLVLQWAGQRGLSLSELARAIQRGDDAC
jgi:hypothetical protein